MDMGRVGVGYGFIWDKGAIQVKREEIGENKSIYSKI